MDYTWLNEAANDKNLTLDDVERAQRYAKDLLGGLKTLRQFPQGVTVFGSARIVSDNEFYQKALELGEKLAKAGHSVITGGGPGIMEAANRGAFEAGGQSIGLNIDLPTEQNLNRFTTDSAKFRYFFARKVMLTFASKVYVFFPGGFGTLDEFSEILELKHTGKIPPAPLFLFGRTFWQPLDQFFNDKFQANKLIEPAARELYVMTDDVGEIVAATGQIERQSIGDASAKSGAV
ncbi:MAG: TIGR00730 family Rossman fold protein [Candidatus Nomurabacteria bacterium]|jgi:uncharacterized protein (TIGR00730 family)|nr:TIGR00730 family Rossman fold protein [Candidatus Nomurabacteria bacterium]